MLFLHVPSAAEQTNLPPSPPLLPLSFLLLSSLLLPLSLSLLVLSPLSSLFLNRQTDPIEFVENISENMQLFPKEDFLTGDQLMFEYDPQVRS